jgi:arginine transport system substrate-binding protein
MVLDIKYGKSLAMIVEPQVGERLLKKTPELKKLEVPIAKEFQTFGMGIGFAKNSAFAKKVTEIIGAMRTDSTLENLEQKWQLYDGRQL